MDDEDAGGAGRSPSELESRLPTEGDLVRLCRRLNEVGARYVVIGGVRELNPGEIGQYGVVRVADEVVVVDLMASSCEIEYAEAARNAIVHEIQGVPIPFASPQLLWRTKVRTHREKDRGDLVFLRDYFAAHGEEPPMA